MGGGLGATSLGFKNMLHKYFKMLLLFVLFFFNGCSPSEYFMFDPNNEYIVNFYLSNQNPDTKILPHFLVTLIYIGEHENYMTVFDKDCSFGEGINVGHSLISNKLILKEGPYKLTAETNASGCILDVRFEITKDQWIYIGYNNQEQLKIHFSSSPFIFG